MERLKNIHIENYPFSTQELPVLALIKLYLSQTNEPIKAIDTALSSRAGLEFLIEKAKASVAIKDEYSHDKRLTKLGLFLRSTSLADWFIG